MKDLLGVRLRGAVTSTVVAVGPMLHMSAANLLQHKLRLLVGLSGIVVALSLLIMQSDALEATRSKVTALFDFFHFDLAIVPASYQILPSSGTFERVRLSQARTVPQITGVYGINIGVSDWSLDRRRNGNSLLMIGLDKDAAFIRDNAVRAGMPLLADGHSVLFDFYSQADLGPIHVGQFGIINDQRLAIAGLFRLGLFFYEPGSVIVTNTEFSRLTGRNPQSVTIGLLQARPGVDPVAVKRELETALPDDVQVLTRAELIQQEQAYFVDTKPIGIMVDAGMIIACLVAATIMIQVLATEVGNRVKEFAVLKAMGFSPTFVYGLAIFQATILAALAVVPALLVSGAVLAFLNSKTHLPTGIDLHVAALATSVAMATASFAAISTLWRIRKADPVELF